MLRTQDKKESSNVDSAKDFLGKMKTIFDAKTTIGKLGAALDELSVTHRKLKVKLVCEHTMLPQEPGAHLQCRRRESPNRVRASHLGDFELGAR